MKQYLIKIVNIIENVIMDDKSNLLLKIYKYLFYIIQLEYVYNDFNESTKYFILDSGHFMYIMRCFVLCILIGKDTLITSTIKRYFNHSEMNSIGSPPHRCDQLINSVRPCALELKNG
jgi:hypothetical protein